MTNPNEDSIERFRKTAKESIDKLTDDQIGEAFRRFFDPTEPSPNFPQKEIARLVENWLGKLW